MFGNNRLRPMVSVLMNCFNGERYLREAITSVYAQTYDNWEIVFWDNASTDGSAAIAKSCDYRLRYFRGSDTLPLGAARNLALQKAKGEMIAFLDCDDVWLPRTLESQLGLMQCGDYAVCYGGYSVIDSSGRQLRRYVPRHSSGNIFERLLRQFDLTPSTAMIRRSALEETGLQFDSSLVASEEYCLFMQLAVDHGFGVMPDVIARYRIHDGALTNRTANRWWQERVYSLDLLCEKHPRIRALYPEALDEAYARAGYYKARYHMVAGNLQDAREALRSICFLNGRYMVLYMLSFLPPAAWHWVHLVRTGRRIAPRTEADFPERKTAFIGPHPVGNEQIPAGRTTT